MRSRFIRSIPTLDPTSCFSKALDKQLIEKMKNDLKGLIPDIQDIPSDRSNLCGPFTLGLQATLRNMGYPASSIILNSGHPGIQREHHWYLATKIKIEGKDVYQFWDPTAQQFTADSPVVYSVQENSDQLIPERIIEALSISDRTSESFSLGFLKRFLNQDVTDQDTSYTNKIFGKKIEHSHIINPDEINHILVKSLCDKTYPAIAEHLGYDNLIEKKHKKSWPRPTAIIKNSLSRKILM